MQKLRNQTLDPLKTRLEGAVLAVSREKKLQVVVDKRIVVYGVEDVTEDVKKLFQSKEALKTGEEVDTSKSPIGYFDQDVVRSLKVFDTAELKVFERRQKMQAEFQKRQADLSPSERQMMMERMSMELESYRQQLFEPLMSQVQSSVKEVAEAQGVALVLDKQHVMQGGRNMTNDVVETFLKKANVGDKKPKANASATPAPAETP
jgi:outer membrane protein